MNKEKMHNTISKESFEEVERYWRETLCRPTEKELMKIFSPESAQVVREKISEWQEEKQKVEKVVIEKIQIIEKSSADEFSKWYCYQIISMFEGVELVKIKQHFNHLKLLLPQDEKSDRSNRVSEEMIEKAQVFPIADVAENAGIHLMPIGGRFKALCIFHHEKTPSLVLYPETNSFYCFGCQKGGNVINFYMELNSSDFVTAIKFLNQI